MRQHLIPFLKRNIYIDVYGFDDYAEKFNDICVINHMGELYLKNGAVDDIRCPYFRLRGSPVTEEQAGLIRETYPNTPCCVSRTVQLEWMM